jgi:beta-glucanase (GH16 family)
MTRSPIRPLTGFKLAACALALLITTSAPHRLFATPVASQADQSSEANAETAAATPTVTTAKAQHGAVVVTLHSATANATIYYTQSGAAPTTASPVYEAPFLVASNLTVKAIAMASGHSPSKVATEAFTVKIPSGSLLWSDEFANSTKQDIEPHPKIWTYDTGNSGFGNHELEGYCAWDSNAAPCSAARPNAYVGTDGYLHIVARRSSPGVYTSARLKTQGLFSFRYGRLEFRARVPEAQGLWPAAWLLGNGIATVNWPACGEQDVLERVNAAKSPDWNEGSIHGKGFVGGDIGTQFSFPAGQTAAGWHTYGMIWKTDKIEYYIDDPAKPYATYSRASLSGFPGAVWPFDTGDNFIILNLAIGGDWPGAPNSSTPFPSEFVVDYVRIYAN